MYPTGSFFIQLVHLEICTSTNGWLKLLANMLEGSLKLRVLKLFNVREHSNWWMPSLDRWDPPSSVPECMMSSLEKLEWRGYLGREIELELMSYLLKHSLCLKTVIVTPNEFKSVEEMYQMVEVLASVPVGSKVCRLVFDL